MLSMLSLASRMPGALGVIGKIAGIAFTVDEIAEAFGKNIFGNQKRDNIVDQIAKIFKKDSKEDPKDKNSTTTTTAKPTQTSPQATTTSTKPTPTPPTPPPATTSSSSEPTPTKSTPTADMVQKYEQAWQYRNNPFARGRIEGAWNQMTPEQKQQAKDWAQSKGYDWKEMKLPDAPNVPNANQQPPKAQEATIAPAQMSTPPKPPESVSALPEPKPSLTMIRTGNNQAQQQNVPLTNGPLTDVPLIASANPDNFYVLYSQLSYNVVT